MRIFKTLQEPIAAPTPTSKAKALAKEVIDLELSKCDTENSMPYDYGIYDTYVYGKSDDTAQVLKALYWRGRLQSTVWHIFVMLTQRGYVSANSLRKPMALEYTDAVVSVTWRLSTFSHVRKESSPEMSSDPLPYATWEPNFATHVVSWLATMIVRECSDIAGLLDQVEATGWLGARDEEAFAEYVEHCEQKEFACDPNERTPTAEEKCDVFGFWLPHGLGTAVDDAELARLIDDYVSRFDRIEKAFKAFFDVSDEDLLTEDIQAAHYA